VIFEPGGDIWNLTELPRDHLDITRNILLEPFDLELYAPSKVALNLFDGGIKIIQNFNSRGVDITIKKIRTGERHDLTVPARTLVILDNF
jgi:hypothetical protein